MSSCPKTFFMKTLLTTFGIIFFQCVTSAQSISFHSNCNLIQENDIIEDIGSLNGLTLSMSDEVAGTGPAPFCPAGGSADNQNWLAFVAKEGDYKIIISASNCTELNGFIGMQTAVYTNCDFTESVFCQPNCNSGVTEIPSDQLIPGETYYLILDGCAGSVCDITFWIDDYLLLGCVTEWQSSVGGLGGFSLFNYFYDGDTIILGSTYRRIKIDPTPNFLPIRYIREVDKRVYEYSTFSNSENIIYDFTLDVGDELEYSSGFIGTVAKIDTVVLSSGRYTRWELEGAGPPYRYIEGIGGAHLFYADQLGISDPVYSTSCVYKYCEKIIGLDECMSQMNWDSESNTDISICEGEVITIDDLTISSEGIYTNILTNAVGCDSTVTLNVSVLTIAMTDIQEEICEGESIIISGTVYDESNPIGTEIIQSGATNGCDSIVNVNLSFVPNIIENYQSAICEGNSEVWAGETISSAGDYTFNLVSVLGCDSIINLSVEIIPESNTEFNFESCDESVIEIDGISYTESGAYQFILESASGCDSIVIYNLSFFPLANGSDTILICPGDSVLIDGNPVFVEGEYQSTYMGANGCDSIHTVSIIELLPTDSECLTGVSDLQYFDLNISPNPFSQVINISSEEVINSIEVLSISGIKIDIIGLLDAQEYIYDGSDLASGVYILKVRSGEKIAIQRIVKN